MKRRKKYSFKSDPLFTEVKGSVFELLQKFGVKETMSQVVMIQSVRSYIENQSSQIRTCNAILFKLGVPAQFKNEERRARVFALTAVDEAVKQGSSFDPVTVIDIANARCDKIDGILGKETLVSEEEAPAGKSKAQQAREIFIELSGKSTKDIVEKIQKVIGVEKTAAYSLFYSAKKSLTV